MMSQGGFLLLPPALPVASLFIVAELTHILPSSRWLWLHAQSEGGGGGWCAVILMMLWHLKDFLLVLMGQSGIAEVKCEKLVSKR